MRLESLKQPRVYAVIVHDHNDYDSHVICLTERRNTANEEVKKYVTEIIPPEDWRYSVTIATVEEDGRQHVREINFVTWETIQKSIKEEAKMITDLDFFCKFSIFFHKIKVSELAMM